MEEKNEQIVDNYSAFDLDGPEHKQSDIETRNALADGLLKRMNIYSSEAEGKPVLNRPVRCRCGHTELVYGLSEQELSHLAQVKSTYPCFDCWSRTKRKPKGTESE